MKTVRFAAVVARAGKPEHHLTWTTPQKDRVLRKAANADRLMTVHQQVRGAKKDYGTVGLETGPEVQFFIFPRSLRPYAGSRIVAINYELAGEHLVMSAPPKPKSAKRKKVADKTIPFPNAKNSPTELRRPAPAKSPGSAEPAGATLPEIRQVIANAITDLRGHRFASASQRLMNLQQRIPRD